jgi:aerobic carbon-monoxide dehydrogenase medium subunit
VKPAPFDYARPRNLQEAVELLAARPDEAKILAGGQSLVPMMAFRLATPDILIDLNGVGELEGVRLEDGALVLGAMARHRDAEDFHGLRDRCALVADAVGLIGHPAIRNRGTVGGSIAHADPAAEWPGVLSALGGSVVAAGPKGNRTIDAGELFDTYFTTTLAADEILAEIRLPLPPADAGSAFIELARRHGDFALAGAGVVLELDGEIVAEARVVLIGVADRPFRAVTAESLLRGAAATDETFAVAAASIGPEIEPMSDVHGSSDYRRHVAGVMLRRALETARSRATP